MLDLVYNILTLVFAVFWLVAKVTAPLLAKILVKIGAIFCAVVAMLKILNHFHLIILQ